MSLRQEKSSARDVRKAAALFAVLLGCALLSWWLWRLFLPSHPAPTPEESAEAWLAAHDPHLLTRRQLQDAYHTLIRGYLVPQTGLYSSFPGTGDQRLIQQAATYDEAVVGLLLLKLGHVKEAGSILRFYEGAWTDSCERSGTRVGRRGLANFYNAYFAVEGIEKTIHVGPNAWIGLFASRYHRKTGDRDALRLALNIAHWVMTKVPHDQGAVAMGEIPWNSTPWDKIHSTENNISYYAFLSDMLAGKGLASSDRRAIESERAGIGRWLIQSAYNRKTGEVIRGFHPGGLDTAGATDSYTWYMQALGPGMLSANGISPLHLMRFAANKFSVVVNGHIGIDCVDKAMAEATYKDDLAKGINDPLWLRPTGDAHRLVWYEGQGQYVVTLQAMARFVAVQAFSTQNAVCRRQLLERAARWLERADRFTRSMDSASFQMPWGRTYPCATLGRFYTYGWPAPQPGRDHPADAVAPLAWRLFSGMGYDPLSDTQIMPHSPWRVAAVAPPPRVETPILYGASEEMTTRAWQLLDRKDYEAARQQAHATVETWEEDAKKLEKLKEQVVGGYLPYDGSLEEMQKIHDYWALNDVTASYFILATIAHIQHRYDEARQDFALILKDFHLAQMWDEGGWFWNPVDTIGKQYIAEDPVHYGSLASLIPGSPSEANPTPVLKFSEAPSTPAETPH